MARLTLPSRLELKRPDGSSNEAPLAKVNFTTALYVSPVQIIPSCDHTGVPLHFHSSTTSGSACLMSARSRESISPRQSSSSLILASINSDGDPDSCGALFFTTSSPFGAAWRNVTDILLTRAGPQGDWVAQPSSWASPMRSPPGPRM